MVPQKKPAPDVFLLAAEHLGLSPSACIVIGDSPADVFAAAAAGMDVYLIPDQVPVNEKTSAISCCVLTEIGQLPSVLEGRLDCMIDLTHHPRFSKTQKSHRLWNTCGTNYITKG